MTTSTSAVPNYPFSALVGLDALTLALRLAAVDHRLSVLARGDKGAGKSTAARGVAALLDAGAPFLTLPLGATEDRLLGGLDLERTLAGEPALKRGLLAQAHGGVLYVDEINLLPDHLADTLLDVVASGTLVVEREGFSASQPADFLLLGSMNAEEGALRPQLLDRFALAVDVEAPMAIDLRMRVIDRRLAFDLDPAAFIAAWSDIDAALAAQLAAARARLHDVAVPDGSLRYIAGRIVADGVRSLRADLAVVRAGRAYAALLGDPVVTDAHVDVVLPLALTHRAPAMFRRPPTTVPPEPTQPEASVPRPPSATDSPQSESSPDRSSEAPSAGEPPDTDAEGRNQNGMSGERVFAPLPLAAPRLSVMAPVPSAVALPGTGNGQGSGAGRHGEVVALRASAQPRELDPRASVLHAAVRGDGHLRADDLRERVRAHRAPTRFIVVVDSSGSHGVHDRMRQVKGAVSALLGASKTRGDEVVLIACRGATAQVLLEPTASVEDVNRALEYLATGGRTPLAHALEVAAGYATARSALLVITDGHANVPSRTSDGRADALAAAQAIDVPALVVDTEDEQRATGLAGELATALRAARLRLADLDGAAVVRLTAVAR